MKKKVFKWGFLCLLLILPVLLVQAGELMVGQSKTYKSLTIFPVINEDAQEPPEDYLTLNEAIEEELLIIEEVSEGGSVNTLKATNKSNRPIFIIAGEVIEGAKQNRTIGKDIIIPPLAKGIEIPVFCVEQGRWNYKSDKFSNKNRIVTKDVRSSANIDSNQSKVWSKVAVQNEKFNQSAGTGDYTVIYSDEKIQKKIKEIKDYFKNMPEDTEHMVGVIVFIGTENTVLDVFGSRGLFEKKWDALLESYIIDSLDVEEPRKVPAKSEAEAFLKKAVESKEKETKKILNTEQEKVQEADFSGVRVKDKDGKDLHLNFYK